jgi:hypothetical protein
MPGRIKPDAVPCIPACSKVVKFMTDHTLPPGAGISLPPYTSIDGYRHLTIFVRFSQEADDEPPVELGVMFAFDALGAMAARHYVNLAQNLGAPQPVNFIEVSGAGSWHGSPHNISSYMARFPVLGPFVEVFLYNRAPISRTVSVWGYLVA